MKGTSLKIFSAIFLMVLGCDKSDGPNTYLGSIDSHYYYAEDFLGETQQPFYGLWKLYDVSGGFAGSGHEPEYELLELKSIGIYGLIKGENLIEYGKIELDTFDHANAAILQLKFIPEFPSTQSSLINPAEKYVQFRNADSLDLNSPCCDMYNYHYRRLN